MPRWRNTVAAITSVPTMKKRNHGVPGLSAGGSAKWSATAAQAATMTGQRGSGRSTSEVWLSIARAYGAGALPARGSRLSAMRDEIGVLRVAVDVCLHVRAAGDDPESFAAGVFERRCGE